MRVQVKNRWKLKVLMKVSVGTEETRDEKHAHLLEAVRQKRKDEEIEAMELMLTGRRVRGPPSPMMGKHWVESESTSRLLTSTQVPLA
jgi:hypothetical protein